MLVENPCGLSREFESLEGYRKSWFWKATRVRYQLSGRPMTCFICGDGEIQLHHRSYRNLGSEDPAELVALCEKHHWAAEVLVREHRVSRWDAHLLVARMVRERRDGLRLLAGSVEEQLAVYPWVRFPGETGGEEP